MHIKHALYIEGKGEREILLKRVFAAPPEMVFDAYTKPELQITILYESIEAREAVLNSQTARGIANSYDRLEAFLVGLLSDPGRS